MSRPTITVEEAKRRHDEKVRTTNKGSSQSKANGHDPKVRELTPLGLHQFGPVEAQDQLVDGLLGNNQLSVLYGESGSGKSFVAFDMAVHFALRREWMGHRVAGGGVIYIAAEGRGGWANRVSAFCKHHGLDEEQRAMVPFWFVLESINLGRNGGGDVAAVIALARRAVDTWQEAARLIVIDTVARAMPGSNENDSVDMGAFVANMDAIRESTGATQVGVHHSGKNAALGARGHSSLRAAVDCELEVERRGSSRVLRVRKSRDGGDGFEQGFQLATVEIGRTDDDAPITSCVVQPAEAGKAKPKTLAKSQRLLSTTLDQALSHHGIDLQLPEDGPHVKAVNREYARNGYVHKRADLSPEDARRTFNRLLGKAIETEFVLSREVSGTVYLFWPTKQ